MRRRHPVASSRAARTIHPRARGLAPLAAPERGRPPLDRRAHPPLSALDGTVVHCDDGTATVRLGHGRFVMVHRRGMLQGERVTVRVRGGKAWVI